MAKSVCFVLMPFGVKMDAAGRSINFDTVYEQIFKPAVIASGLMPVRADEEQVQGFIHKLMYERLLLSEYAIADLTILNANVYYELGVRHAAKPQTTVMTMAGQSGLPFDVAGLRVLPYTLDQSGVPADAATSSATLTDLMKSCIAKEYIDSPIYQLVDGMKPPPIDPARSDIFRERTAASEAIKAQLAKARGSNKSETVAMVEQSLGTLAEQDASIVLDLLLSYRAVGAHQKVVDVIGVMDKELAKSFKVRELLAFAQNRLGLSKEAEVTLNEVIAAQGPSSETLGLLGRVYKDRWDKAVKADDPITAKSELKKAIRAYQSGFETDWRDIYPGVNAVTLMEIADDGKRLELLPVVRYAAERRLASRGNSADYWDYATRFEIAVLEDAHDVAEDMLGLALGAVDFVWEPLTTKGNLDYVLTARRGRNVNTDKLVTYINALNKKIESFQV